MNVQLQTDKANTIKMPCTLWLQTVTNSNRHNAKQLQTTVNGQHKKPEFMPSSFVPSTAS